MLPARAPPATARSVAGVREELREARLAEAVHPLLSYEDDRDAARAEAVVLRATFARLLDVDFDIGDAAAGEVGARLGAVGAPRGGVHLHFGPLLRDRRRSEAQGEKERGKQSLHAPLG